MNEIATIIPATTIKTDAKRLLIKAEQVTIINGNNDATDEEKAEARKLVEKRKLKPNLILQIVILKGKSMVLKPMG